MTNTHDTLRLTSDSKATLLETIYKDFYSSNTSYRDIFSYIENSSSNDKEKHDAILDLQAQVSSGIHFYGLVHLNLLNQHIIDSSLYRQATIIKSKH